MSTYPKSDKLIYCNEDGPLNGYCYLHYFPVDRWEEVVGDLGCNPLVKDVATYGPSNEARGVSVRFQHVHVVKKGVTTFSRLLAKCAHCRVGGEFSYNFPLVSRRKLFATQLLAWVIFSGMFPNLPTPTWLVGMWLTAISVRYLWIKVGLSSNSVWPRNDGFVVEAPREGIKGRQLLAPRVISPQGERPPHPNRIKPVKLPTNVPDAEASRVIGMFPDSVVRGDKAKYHGLNGAIRSCFARASIGNTPRTVIDVGGTKGSCGASALQVPGFEGEWEGARRADSPHSMRTTDRLPHVDLRIGEVPNPLFTVEALPWYCQGGPMICTQQAYDYSLKTLLAHAAVNHVPSVSVILAMCPAMAKYKDGANCSLDMSWSSFTVNGVNMSQWTFSDHSDMVYTFETSNFVEHVCTHVVQVTPTVYYVSRIAESFGDQYRIFWTAVQGQAERFGAVRSYYGHVSASRSVSPDMTGCHSTPTSIYGTVAHRPINNIERRSGYMVGHDAKRISASGLQRTLMLRQGVRIYGMNMDTNTSSHHKFLAGVNVMSSLKQRYLEAGSPVDGGLTALTVFEALCDWSIRLFGLLHAMWLRVDYDFVNTRYKERIGAVNTEAIDDLIGYLTSECQILKVNLTEDLNAYVNQVDDGAWCLGHEGDVVEIYDYPMPDYTRAAVIRQSDLVALRSVRTMVFLTCDNPLGLITSAMTNVSLHLIGPLRNMISPRTDRFDYRIILNLAAITRVVVIDQNRGIYMEIAGDEVSKIEAPTVLVYSIDEKGTVDWKRLHYPVHNVLIDYLATMERRNMQCLNGIAPRGALDPFRGNRMNFPGRENWNAVTGGNDSDYGYIAAWNGRIGAGLYWQMLMNRHSTVEEV